MKTKFDIWLKALVAAIITGCSNSFLAALGISGAQAVGIDIEQLKPKQLLATTIVGGIIGMFSYLKSSPVPADETNQWSKIDDSKTK